MTKYTQPKRLPLPLKWHGGKYYLAPEIVALMPPHRHYVEPFFGGGSVLLARSLDDPSLFLTADEGVSEVVNDLNSRLINFWRVLQDENQFRPFARILEAMPLAREEWQRAHDHTDGQDAVANAVAFFVDCRQSLAGRMKGFTSLTRNRTRRKMNGNVSEWLSSVDGLSEVHARLKRVAIECMEAVDLIRREDTPETLFYCDPPYLHQTRASTDAYDFEMTEADHRELLDQLKRCKGKVMISGYPSRLYDHLLNGWREHSFDLPNNAAGGDEKRRMTECLWCNF